MTRLLRTIAAGTVLAGGLGACAASPLEAPTTLELRELNESGVSGTVTMTAVDDRNTLVEVSVEASTHRNMPAHIHPGTCAALVPQPKYPLDNVVDGRSTTEVPASVAELLSGGQALNIHMSNEQMDVYSACGELSIGPAS